LGAFLANRKLNDLQEGLSISHLQLDTAFVAPIWSMIGQPLESHAG